MNQKKVEIGAKMAKNYIKKNKKKIANIVAKVEKIIFFKPKLGQKRHKKLNSQVTY